MSFSYAFGSNPSIDYPRMLTGDTQQFQADGVSRAYIFEDSEILAAAAIDSIAIFSPTGGGQTQTSGTSSYRYTAATLLESLAASKARLAGIGKMLDIELQHETAAKELRATAEALRDAERKSGAFAIVEMIPDQFSARERLFKTMLRLQA